MNGFTNDELARQIAALEERMNTRQAEQESAIERIRIHIEESNVRMEKRDKSLIKAVYWTAILMTVFLSIIIINT